MSDISKKMMVSIGALSLLAMGAGVVYYRSFDCLPFLAGTLLGALTSVLKVILLAKGIDKALTMEQARATAYIYGQHVLRLVLTAAALVAAALIPWLSLWGAVVGVLTYQISLYILNIFMKKR